MKFILIAAALNLQMTYPSEDICKQALDVVKEQDPKAICIPAGETREQRFLSSFMNMVESLEKSRLTNPQNGANIKE